MERVVAYVDGYNLYFGLREKRWKQFYWLNIQAMVTHLLRAGQTLVATHYFTTVVQRPEAKRLRQAAYLEALQTLTGFDIQYGQFLAETVVCRTCGASYETYHEKMTDVNIAVALMSDVYQDRFDTAMLVSADSDLVGPVRAARSLFSTKRVVVAFPPFRSSKALMKAASAYTYIGRVVVTGLVTHGLADFQKMAEMQQLLSVFAGRIGNKLDHTRLASIVGISRPRYHQNRVRSGVHATRPATTCPN